MNNKNNNTSTGLHASCTSGLQLSYDSLKDGCPWPSRILHFTLGGGHECLHSNEKSNLIKNIAIYRNVEKFEVRSI